MYKIFISVRNRLQVTKKCIESIIRHSDLPNQIYIYDNITDYKLKEHFEYFYNLIKNNLISQYTFNTKESTFNAFSKVVSCNQFGNNHLMDPDKNNYDFLLFLDNDILVMPNFDTILTKSWKDVNNLNLKNIKIIGQYPGGIKSTKQLKEKIGGFNCKIGKLGGSGFWSVRPNFFSDIGFLDVKKFVNIHKRHDQMYWRKLDEKSENKEYILGLETKLCIHCGKMAGSVCNTLTKNQRNKNINDLIKFEKAEEDIEKMTFQQFFDKVKNDKSLMNDW